MASLVQRMIRASMLNTATYEEVEADEGALGQALTIVVLSSVAAGIGSLGAGVTGLLGGLVAALVGWFIWVALIWLIGTKLLPEPQTEADLNQVMRTVGFASSPGVLRVVGIIPCLGLILNFCIAIWMLVASVVAVRQALDYKSTGRAVGVCLIGFVVYLFVVAGFAIFIGAAGAAAGAFG